MCPLISIIMPVHNGHDYLKSSIQSALNQTYTNFELIIINDGSTDNSGDIIKSFHDSRIRYISLNTSHGPAIARNKGLDVASGKYITFLDADDLWLSNNLRFQLLYMSRNNLDFVYGYFDFIYSSGRIKKKVTFLPKSLTYFRLLMSNPIKISSCLIKATVIRSIRFPNIGNEDYAFWLLIFRQCKNIRAGVFPYRETKIRLHSNSVSSNKFKSCKWVWHIYRYQEKLSLLKALFFFVIYAVQGIIKHQNIFKI